jgi:ribonuclease HI
LAKKPKFICVWVGSRPGVFDSWDKAKSSVTGFPGAKFKSFDTRQAAETAFRGHWQEYYEEKGSGGARKPAPKVKREEGSFPPEVVVDSVCVDAACSGNPGVMEYRGVDTTTGFQFFLSERYPMGTNNIGEFLALVHALALWHEEKPKLTIYTDSVNAMSWVRQGKCKTKLPLNAKTAKLHSVVERAEKWLATHKWTNPILKWKTEEWGEIPADFGRK